MKPVTLWSYWKSNDEGVVFNHLEDGHSEADRPTPKFDSQKGWNGLRWEKEHTYLDDENKVIDEDTAFVRAVQPLQMEALAQAEAEEEAIPGGRFRQKRSGLIVEILGFKPNRWMPGTLTVMYQSKRAKSVNRAALSWFLENYERVLE